MKQLVTLILFICFFSRISLAQVAISTDGAAADANTMLDIRSNSKGVKLPRLTTQQRNAIPTSPSDFGLLVYDTDKSAVYLFDGQAWMPLALGSGTSVGRTQLAPSSFFGQFGWATDIDGDYAAVGAMYDSVNNALAYAGSVYMYHRINGAWIRESKVLPSDPHGYQNFGSSVVVRGDWMVVGAKQSHNGSITHQGAVYVFKRSGPNWVQQAKLTPPSLSTNMQFGWCLAFDGTTLVVGAPTDDVGNLTDAGSVYVYNFTGNAFSYLGRLTPPAAATNDNFGRSVAIHGDYLVAGAPYRDVPGATDNGAAYVYVKGGGTFTLQQELNPYVDDHAQLGASVAVEGDIVVVGAPNAKSAANDMRGGLVRIHRRSGASWTAISPELMFVESAFTSIRFGTTVRIRAGRILVAAPYALNNELAAGAVYLLDRSLSQAFEIRKRIQDPEGIVNGFGSAIGFDGQNFLIGSPNENDRGKVLFGSLAN